MKSRISTKGQVTVPVDVRRALGFAPGMAVEFMVREGEAVMRKGREGAHPVDVVYGQLKLPRAVDALIEEMRGSGPIPAKAARRSRKRPRR